MTATTIPAPSRCSVDFCGEAYPVPTGRPFTIGRDGDLALRDNRYLHRRFLEILDDGEWCWVRNVGNRLTATVFDPGGYVHATLAAGARLPLMLPRTLVLFSAGPMSYELGVHVIQPAYSLGPAATPSRGETTLGGVDLTPSQRLLVLALAEPALRRRGTGSSTVPSSADAARRLGWPLTTFNRKLDNVCDKLSRSGVLGLRGGVGQLATHRRARLVEHAIGTRLVSDTDLELLPPRS